MGRVQDMVTGLLYGSSSMIPLFFKSSGVGFAEEKIGAKKKTGSLFKQHKIQRNDNKKHLQLVLNLKRLTFPVRFEVAVDGWWCDITEATGPVTQGGTAALTSR